MKLLTLLSVVPALWRFAKEMARGFEEAVPSDGFGSQKLAAFDAILRALLAASDDADEAAEAKLIPLGTTIVNTAVSLMKTTGELQKIAEKSRANLEADLQITEAVFWGAVKAAQDEASGD